VRLQPERGDRRHDVHVELLEAVLVQPHLEPLARCELALGVLRRDALLAHALPGGGAAAFELLDVRGQCALPVMWERCSKEGALIQLRLSPCGAKSPYPSPASGRRRRSALSSLLLPLVGEG